MEIFPGSRPVVWYGKDLPVAVPVLMLAPHPDDFDAIAVTLDRLRCVGCPLCLAVMTGGAAGVDPDFAGDEDLMCRSRIREAEQLQSAARFGLPGECVTFMRMPEADDGEVRADHAAVKVVRRQLELTAAGVVCLPHGKDANAGHRRAARLLRRACSGLERPVTVLWNRDAKTRNIREDLYVPFDENTAAWKADLLRCHRSQQTRNLDHRGRGFDQRVLDVNRRAASRCSCLQPFAEAFEIEVLA